MSDVHPLKAFRETRGLSQEAAASELGLRSKGYISSIESGTWPCPLKLALQIEQWSGGVVPAEQLLEGDDLDLLKATKERGAQPAEARA